MALSKKIRFEVFKRDEFRCCYCGQVPPAVILEVDHIDPKSRGGEDHINNLVTACFDCNRGKKNIPLTKIPPTIWRFCRNKKNKLLLTGNSSKKFKPGRIGITKK